MNMDSNRRNCALFLAMTAVWGCVRSVCGEDRPAANHDGGDVVTIDYADEVPLEALVDYVGQTLDLRVVYGDELRGQQVTLRPGRVELPKDRLLDLLRSVLRVRGLALVPGDLPDYYRIAPLESVQRITGDVRETVVPLEDAVGGRIVTQVIRLEGGETKAIATQVRAFMSSEKASLVEVPERGLLILTDYEPVVARIARLVELIDASPDPVKTEIVPIEHAAAALVGEQVLRVLDDRVKAGEADFTQVQVSAGLLPGKLVVTGPAERLSEALDLIRAFDVPSGRGREIRAYSPRHTSAERVKRLIEGVLLRDPKLDAEGVSVFIDDAANRLYVTAAPDVHAAVEVLLDREDRASLASSRPLRIYRPRNRKAGEIMDTLIQLLEEATVGSVVGEAAASAGQPTTAGTAANRRGLRPPEPPEPPAAAPAARRVDGPDWVLTEDEHTNAIIAIGSPEFQGRLAELIDELDARRSQVMIEMMLVAVTLSDALNFGVELKGWDMGGSTLGTLFTDFGLSTFDVQTGQVALSPGVGMNGALLRPNDFSIVMQALASHGNSRVLATPRLLVADGTEGTLRSVDEAPFTSVNASDTVATTSFGGFESAGTTLTVMPQIAEGDHLSLEYNLSFSNFTGSSGSTTAPPPRTTNSFAGQVEVPDGYTVVVGGLTVENETDSVDEIPLLGRIPGLGLLFQNSATSRTQTRVYAFIRPVILRDDRFEDLKFITAQDLKAAELTSKDYPADRYMWMK